jgi:putative acetyltransferase
MTRDRAEIEVRGERPEDESAIDTVVARAFGSLAEASIVRWMRRVHPTFDPRFSLCAWAGSRLVGHALFTPARVRIHGRTVRALGVGPVAVAPSEQRRGIGGCLLRHGHQLGFEYGYGFAFLCGHPSYYPRHGYRVAFGFAKALVDAAHLPAPTGSLSIGPVTAEDVPWLCARQAVEWADVDFGWLWEPRLSAWDLPGAYAVMLRTPAGEPAAYVLSHPRPERDALVLAEDPALARDAIATVRPTALVAHPSGWLARHVLEPEWASVTLEPSLAAMACELDPGVLDPLLGALELGERPLGSTQWPLPFLLY